MRFASRLRNGFAGTPSGHMTQPLEYRRVLPVVFVVFVDFLGLTIIIPLLPLYATSFGADPLTIGFLGAMYPVAQFIGAPILGRLSDRYGRKPILVLSQVGTLLGFILLGTANALWMLFVSRFIDGFSGGNFSTAQAMIADTTDEKTRTQGLGLIGAAFGIGFVIGPGVAYVALALSGSDYHVPAWVAAGLAGASIILTTSLLTESAPAVGAGKATPAFSFSRLSSALRHPGVGFLLTVVFMQQLAFGGLQQFLSLFLLSRLGMSAAGTAVVFVFVGVLIVFVQGVLIGPLSRRFGEIRMIKTGLVVLTAAFVLTATTPPVTVPWYSKPSVTAELGVARALPGRMPSSYGLEVQIPEEGNSGWLGLCWILVAMVPATLGGGLLGPTLNSLITQRVEDQERGGILGISTALLSGGNAIAPIVGGTLFALGGPTAPFWLWAVFLGAVTFGTRRLN